MKVNRLYLVVLVALLALLVACTPKAAPAPAPASVPMAPPTAPVVTPAGPTLSPEEVAWQKVVEAAKKEGRLTSYTFNFTGEPGQKVAKAFRERYGIQIEYMGGVGSVLSERIKSESAAKKHIADTFDTAVAMLVLFKETGLTQGAGQLPALREEKVWRSFPRLDEDGHIFTWLLGLNTPFVNTKLVRPGEEPKTFKEMAEPKWRGKVVTGAPATSTAGIYPWVVRDRLGLTEEWFRRLAGNDLKFAANIRDSVQQLIIGDRAVLFVCSGLCFGDLIPRGAPVRAIAVDEGAISVMSATIGIVKDAPHPNAARVFINWLLSPEGQQVSAEATNSTPVRADVKDFLPPAAQIEPKRLIPMTIADVIEIGKVQREKTLEKIFGLE